VKPVDIVLGGSWFTLQRTRGRILNIAAMVAFTEERIVYWKKPVFPFNDKILLAQWQVFDALTEAPQIPVRGHDQSQAGQKSQNGPDVLSYTASCMEQVLGYRVGFVICVAPELHSRRLLTKSFYPNIVKNLSGFKAFH
jgi:hypothetical protein